MNESMRVLYHDSFDGKGFTDENSLANMLLTKPDQLDPVLTHLMGREDKRFPLSFLSEGQVGGTMGINDVQFTYDVIGRLERPDEVAYTKYSGTDKPGLGVSIFYVPFRTNWFKDQHVVVSKNGVRAQIKGQLIREGSIWLAPLQLITNDPNAFCPLSELQAGTTWAMSGGANVAESRSRGNESNVVAPGKMKGQLSFLRKSFRLAGNISNKTVEVQFNVGGTMTNAWVEWERWQHMLAWKLAIEESGWDSVYNRTASGEILNRDEKTGEPIPFAAGVLSQIPNQDDYAVLTAKKIRNTVRDVMYGAADGGVMDVVLFTGIGGQEEFDRALKSEAAGFTQIVGDKFVRGAGRNLILGGYFTQYEHVDGHVITVKNLPLLDHGNRALAARKHPVTGLPITSYEMHFIDVSSYDGKRNLVALHQNGRAMISGILKGMAPTPYDFKGNNNTLINLATEIDESSIHFMCSKAFVLRRNTHCFSLRCNLGE